MQRRDLPHSINECIGLSWLGRVPHPAGSLTKCAQNMRPLSGWSTLDYIRRNPVRIGDAQVIHSELQRHQARNNLVQLSSVVAHDHRFQQQQPLAAVDPVRGTGLATPRERCLLLPVGLCVKSMLYKLVDVARTKKAHSLGITPPDRT